jgi:hypothetical protein
MAIRSLLQFLLDTDLTRLRAIAGFWGVEDSSSRHRDLAALLSRRMAEPAGIARAWHQLADQERAALRGLLSTGGRAPARVVARRWGAIRAMGPGRMEREQPWRDPSSPMEGLYYSGFVFGSFADHGEGGYEELMVPAELMRHLPTEPAPPPQLELQAAAEPPLIVPANDWFLDDACTLLSYVQNHRPSWSPDGSWPENHQRLLEQMLRATDSDRLDLLRHVISALGWIQQAESGRLRLEPEPVLSWLEEPAGRQRAALATAWAADPEWNDLRHVPALSFDDTGSWHNDPLRTRRAILSHLSACKPESWYAIADAVAAVKQADPDFQRPDGDYSSWYIRDAYSGQYLSGFECWDRVEGALLRFLIVGPLTWLGLVDLGVGAPGGMMTWFRLSTAGTAFLQGTDPPPDPPPGSAKVRTDLTIDLPADARYQRFQLGRVADLVAPGERYTYRLSGESLRRGQRQGISVQRVLDFLADAAGRPLPHSLQSAITAWAERGFQASVEQVVVLRLADKALMDRVTSAPSTRDLISERIGPTAALVRKRDSSKLVAALAGMGILPDVIGID